MFDDLFAQAYCFGHWQVTLGLWSCSTCALCNVAGYYRDGGPLGRLQQGGFASSIGCSFQSRHLVPFGWCTHVGGIRSKTDQEMGSSNVAEAGKFTSFKILAYQSAFPHDAGGSESRQKSLKLRVQLI